MKRYWTRAALFYVDLDGFKPVNDQHGHAAGDAVLKAVAAMLTRSVRASDTVARLGGDEFGLILWNLSEGDAAAKAWALEAAISEAGVEWEGEMLSVGASIGFAMLGPSDELAGVLAKADHAMYARKAARKGVAGYRNVRSSISRNDVRRELILDKGDPVPQVQLALFQPLNLQNIGTGRRPAAPRSRRRGRGAPARGAQAARGARVLPRVSCAATVPEAARRRESGAETPTSIAR